MLAKIVIIGAGPAGLLLAHYLLQRGKYQVEIYDRRPDPRQVNLSQKRTFPISLQERGQRALRQIEGLESAVLSQGQLIQKTTRYRSHKKPNQTSRKQPLFSIDRTELVKAILQHLEPTYSSEQLKTRFNCECSSIDRSAKTVTLQSREGDNFTVDYTHLVGTDGARSQVRQHLITETGLNCEENYVPDAYKSVFLQRKNPELGTELAADSIHGQTLKDRTRLLLVPQGENQLNGVIIFEAEKNPFEEFSTGKDVKAFIDNNFPDFSPFLSAEEAEKLLDRPVARVLTVRCDRYFSHFDHYLIEITGLKSLPLGSG